MPKRNKTRRKKGGAASTNPDTIPCSSLSIKDQAIQLAFGLVRNYAEFYAAQTQMTQAMANPAMAAKLASGVAAPLAQQALAQQVMQNPSVQQVMQNPLAQQALQFQMPQVKAKGAINAGQIGGRIKKSVREFV
jgi:hypothetical protein